MPDSSFIPSPRRADFPLWKALAASVMVHASAALLVGTMPSLPSPARTGDIVFDDSLAGIEVALPQEPLTSETANTPEPPKTEPDAVPPKPEPPPTDPAPKPPEPKSGALGSETSTSEAQTKTWLGSDELREHRGAPSEVDQAQFTMEAPGPRAALPGEGANARSGAPASPPVPPSPATAPAAPPAPSTPPRALGELPTIIADEPMRPRRETNPPSEAPATSPPPPAARVPDADAGPPREGVKPAAPPPASLPQAVAPQDQRESPNDATGEAPSPPATAARRGVNGPKESPQFPTGKKEIAPPADPKTEIGPERSEVRPAQPPSAEPTETSNDLQQTPPASPRLEPSEKPSDSAKPTPASDRAQVPDAPESQGPRPDEIAEAKENIQRPKSNNPVPQPPAAQPSAPPSPDGLPVPQRTGTGSEGRGILSDRESLASAIKKAIVVEKWGQPLVAKGLRIRTVRPKFSKYTEITSRGSPVVRILFDRSGKAREVILLSSSGVQDVDRPVVDAAYQWTAVGKELEELRENPPETVAIDVRVIR